MFVYQTDLTLNVKFRYNNYLTSPARTLMEVSSTRQESLHQQFRQAAYLFGKRKSEDNEGPSVRAPPTWSENPTSIPRFLPQRKPYTILHSNHPIMLASHTFCLSCSNEQRVLMLHEEEKRQVRSEWTRSSSFARGNVYLVTNAVLGFFQLFDEICVIMERALPHKKLEEPFLGEVMRSCTYFIIIFINIECLCYR